MTRDTEDRLHALSVAVTLMVAACWLRPTKADLPPLQRTGCEFVIEIGAVPPLHTNQYRGN